MAQFKTLLEIKTKVKQDLDLEDEQFISNAELVGYINEAIDECEAHIHTLEREAEYFLAEAFIPLTTGVQEFSLPANIYANKIRSIIYHNGTIIYPIERLRRVNKFEEMAYIEQYNTGTQFYRYVIKHETPGTYQIKLFPQANETSTENVKIWYIRNANKLVVDADLCDIVEWSHYIISYAQWKCYLKEGNPLALPKKVEVDEYRKQMIQALEVMVVDGDNEIEKDFSSYSDQGNYF